MPCSPLCISMGIRSRIPRCCIGERASNDKGEEPDVGMVCGGDFPTLETPSAVDLLFKQVPDREVRIVNVVNHMKLQPRASIRMGCPTLAGHLCFS
ncbi:MAG: hypothetical protein R3B33_00370 [Nitrospirales bacterium]